MSKSILHGDHVYLRRLEASDLDRTWEWMHRAEIAERVGVAVPFSHTQQEAWFQGMDKAGEKMVFAVCRIDDNDHVGNVSLDSIDRRHRHARLSIFIADPEVRGKGLGGDALTVLVRYSFRYLGLRRLWCKVAVNDPRLDAFYSRHGFRREGVMREHEYFNGSYVDKAIWGRIASGS